MVVVAMTVFKCRNGNGGVIVVVEHTAHRMAVNIETCKQMLMSRYYGAILYGMHVFIEVALVVVVV